MRKRGCVCIVSGRGAKLLEAKWYPVHIDALFNMHSQWSYPDLQDNWRVKSAWCLMNDLMLWSFNMQAQISVPALLHGYIKKQIKYNVLYEKWLKVGNLRILFSPGRYLITVRKNTGTGAGFLSPDIAAMRRNSFPDKKKLADRPSVIEGIFFMAEEQHSAHMKQLCRRHIIFVPERRKNICALKK